MQGLLIAMVLASGAAPSYQTRMAPYVAELGRLCPDRHADWLSPAALRDVLDDVKAGLPPDQRNRMDRAEATDCADSIAGASCPNLADIRVAGQLGLTRRLAARVCSAVKLCRSPSDCE